MNYCNNSFCLWLSQHIVTVLLLAIISVFTFIYNLFPFNTYVFFDQFSIFFCRDLCCYGWFVIWQFLLSGLEVSIGSNKYFAWLFFNSFLVFTFRYFLNIETKSSYFLLYSQFISFLMMHKPYIYITIKNKSFTDTHLYIIGMIQTIILCENYFDILIVLFGNILFKIILKLLKPCIKPTRMHTIMNDNQGIGAETNLQQNDDDKE